MIKFMFPYTHKIALFCKGHGLVVRKDQWQFQLLLVDMHYRAYFISGPWFKVYVQILPI